VDERVLGEVACELTLVDDEEERSDQRGILAPEEGCELLVSIVHRIGALLVEPCRDRIHSSPR
jgi:hypothetical protein